MKVVIELPGIKAVSRNETGGHYFKYRERLIEAEQWMITYGRRHQHHFDKRVDVLIQAHYDTRAMPALIRNSKTERGAKLIGKSIIRRRHEADAPNIDDKIFTDILNRYKPATGGKIERSVWFIEDDAPKYLRRVIKESIATDHYKVVIEITDEL